MGFFMPLPKLGDAQITWVTRWVAKYIQYQRRNYGGRATLLNADQKRVMQAFFPRSTLDSSRVLVLSGERVRNPPFYPQLQEMGFEPSSLPDFSLMAAITFEDTVVSHEAFTNRLLFHELVHVVQYEKLGLQEFSSKYVRGFMSGGSYDAIPLERNAYELDARFAAAPAKPFSVADAVQSWIDTGRFYVGVRHQNEASRRSRLVSAPALVRLGATRMDSDARPPSTTDTAHRLTCLRHRGRVGSVAAVSAHFG